MDAPTRLLHLLALATYLGSTLALVLAIIPAVESIDDLAVQRRMLSPALTAYNLLTVGALGVMIMTGASSLTTLKSTMLADYGMLLWPLVTKLSLTFALTITGTWVSFGIAHRLVRAERMGDPVDPARQKSLLKRLRAAGWIAIALAVWTTWVGLRMSMSL